MSETVLLKIAILETLKQFDRPINEKTIMLSLSVTYSMKSTYTEVRECLSMLEENRYILSITNAIRGVLWGLTDKGHAELSNC